MESFLLSGLWTICQLRGAILQSMMAFTAALVFLLAVNLTVRARMPATFWYLSFFCLK